MNRTLGGKSGLHRAAASRQSDDGLKGEPAIGIRRTHVGDRERALQALAVLVGSALSRNADEMIGREIWLKFATWILLALEFALAADLVRTAVAPTWDDISKLAVIATIRQGSTRTGH